MKKFLLILCAVGLTAVVAEAQVAVGKGQLSGSLESNNIYYGADKKLDELGLAQRPELPFGSHDFLKLDYNLGRFSAGIQFDGYLPALDGYDIATYQQRDTKLTGFFTKYIQWEDTNYGVRVGDIFDQFGNGLVFRTYEDRALGFNNSLAGARVHYNFDNYFSVKALAGMPRLYDVRSRSLFYGADLSLSISDMAGWYGGLIAIEGSYVGRYQNGASEILDINANPLATEYLNMVSGRVNFEVAGFSLRGEYAQKLNNDIYNVNFGADKGNVIHVDLGYNYKRFSASATFRRYEGMQTSIEAMESSLGGGNVINYLPQLTRQYTYMLANLNPYRGCASMTGNEIGGQFDAYYSLRNKKDRSKYWNFHANFSMFNTIAHESFGEFIDGRNAWVDVNFDVERQWSRKLKTTLLYSYQRWDEELNHWDSPHAKYCDSHIFVGDVTYKFTKKHSLRVEAQYLYDSSNSYEGDWVAALVEYNFAPMFSVYVSDMWNCEATDGNYNYASEENELLHYYQVGASFTHSRYRVQLSYGRNRAGYVCSGGVCRYQPAYTGINLSLTASF
ncbi:MAG: hypothetical protein IKA81_02770 [Alistipes sp.]|nr:hypothetical protein [Alistipes sp.]